MTYANVSHDVWHLNWLCMSLFIRSCWLAREAFYYAFMAPVALIILINTVFFILIIKGITCNRLKGIQNTQGKAEITMLQVQAALMTFIVLGETFSSLIDFY